MNTEQDIQTPQDTTTQPEAGTLLKQKRESLGLSQKQIADRLKLRISVIEQIEDNQFESGQVATFTRGYLRSYAKAVCLDEKVVLNALDHAGDAQHEEQEMQSFSRKTKTEQHNSRIMSLTWGIFAVIAGISSLWWWQNQQQDTLSLSLSESVENVQVPAEEVTTVDVTELETIPEHQLVTEEVSGDGSEAVTEDVQPITEVATPVQLPEIEETAASMEASEAVVEEEQALAEEKAVEPSSLENELALQFSSDCWIQVKDATGKTLSTGIKKAGQSLKLSGTAPYKVVLGAPEGVSMTFASEPVDLSGYTSGKVARITLP